MNTRFQMVRITVPQFAILSEEMPENEIQLKTELEYKYNTDSPLLMVNLGYKFLSEGSDTPILVLQVSCEFSVHPEDWEKLKKNDEMELPKSLMEIMAVHTVGTSRGILFCKTEGTPFSGLMIPPLNVRKMLEYKREKDA